MKFHDFFLIMIKRKPPSLFVNTQPVIPVTVTSGLAKYPDVSEILDVLSEKYIVKAFNADELAFEAGNRLQ